MAVPALPAHFTARPLRRDDLIAVHALVTAYERRVLNEPMSDLEDFEGDWQRPSFEPEQDAVVVLDGEELVGWAEVYKARQVTGCVHPDSWGHGIGDALVGWAAGRVAELGGELVGQTVPDTDTRAAELFRSRGWSSLWTSWVLEVPPGSVVAERALPVAVDDAGDVVGACHLVMSGDTGWVNQVAVDRAHRGRGIAQALLAQAFAAARERGAPRGELSTDSRTGALGLYERLGMQVKHFFTQYAGAPQA